MSQSKLSCASGFSSSSSEIGLISSSANLRAVICQARCSLLREKSMEVPSILYVVMPALVAGIHALAARGGVDGRDKPGHDGVEMLFVSRTWPFYSAASIEGPRR
jgi:hypothetical protein